MNTLEAYQDLKNILTENIENVILVKDKKITSNLLVLCELYKDGSKLKKLIDDYSYEFKDSTLSLDNLEERLEFLKNTEFNNFVLKWIHKIYDTNSLSVIDFVLDRYFASKNLHLSNPTVLE